MNFGDYNNATEEGSILISPREIRNLRKGIFSLLGGKYIMGQFAIVGILLIIIDFIPLAVGLGKSKGSFQSKFIKTAVPIWLVMLVLGIILIIIP